MIPAERPDRCSSCGQDFEYYRRTADTETVAGLTAHLARRRQVADPSSVRLGLVHKHVPRLEERGWVEYDERTETIRYHGHADARYLLTRALELFGESV